MTEENASNPMPTHLLNVPDVPQGESVTISRAEYRDLVDIRDHVRAMRDVAAGEMPVISSDDLDAYLAARTPLAFWREHRGLTQTELAAAAEISQPFLNQLEHCHRQASVATLARLARRLGVRVDDLIAD